MINALIMLGQVLLIVILLGCSLVLSGTILQMVVDIQELLKLVDGSYGPRINTSLDSAVVNVRKQVRLVALLALLSTLALLMINMIFMRVVL